MTDKTCGTCAKFKPDWVEGTCPIQDIDPCSDDDACVSYQPRTDNGCPVAPCDTIKRQARRINELMQEKDALEQVARDMYTAIACNTGGDTYYCGNCGWLDEDCECTALDVFRERLKALGIEI